MVKIFNFLFVTFLIVVLGCKEPAPLAVISVTETAGLERDIEYISVEIPFEDELKDSEVLWATDVETKKSTLVQITDTLISGQGQLLIVTFPVTIGTNQTKNFHLNANDRMEDDSQVDLTLSEDGIFVENKFFKASFSTESDNRGGQIDGVVLKEFGNQLLKRDHIPMHWAPNFTKSNAENGFNLEDLPPSSENRIKSGMYNVIKSRSGNTDSVPEIRTEGTYEFFANMPYFLFESIMTVEKDVELSLLRNDEMTMDSLFTHVMYQRKDGSISNFQLYDIELDVLEEKPIADDAPWMAFYNADKGYGFGSLRLEYDNTNLDGNPSPLYKPYTKVSKGSNAGRYWNRILIGKTDTLVQKGSRYKEKNAYLVFKVDAQNPEKEILEYHQRLTSPLSVNVGE